MVRKTSAAEFVGAGSPASTSFTHISASSTPAGRARRARPFRPEVSVDSSSSLLGDARGRSWCVSRCPLSTSVSGRVVGAGASNGDVSRTVMPMIARALRRRHIFQTGDGRHQSPHMLPMAIVIVTRRTDADVWPK